MMQRALSYLFVSIKGDSIIPHRMGHHQTALNRLVTLIESGYPAADTRVYMYMRSIGLIYSCPGPSTAPAYLCVCAHT